MLNRYTYASTLSHLRRTNTPIGRDGKIAKPDSFTTHTGGLCVLLRHQKVRLAGWSRIWLSCASCLSELLVGHS